VGESGEESVYFGLFRFFSDIFGRVDAQSVFVSLSSNDRMYPRGAEVSRGALVPPLPLPVPSPRENAPSGSLCRKPCINAQ